MTQKGLIALTVLMATTGEAEPTDQELELHSDSGIWKFYPAQDVDASLPNILLIGDSIMSGYRGQVISRLAGKANVDCWLTPVHLNSNGLHEDLEKVVSFRKYDLIHFNIGLHGWPEGRILTKDYPQLLTAYVEILKQQAPNATLIWGSITPVHEKDGQELNKEINPIIVRRNRMAAVVMKNERVTINDLYGLMSDKLDLVRGDQFHWQSQAYTVMAEQIVTTIREKWSGNGASL